MKCIIILFAKKEREKYTQKPRQEEKIKTSFEAHLKLLISNSIFNSLNILLHFYVVL